MEAKDCSSTTCSQNNDHVLKFLAQNMETRMLLAIALSPNRVEDAPSNLKVNTAESPEKVGAAVAVAPLAHCL